MRAKSIMVVGTMSSAGKSVVTAGLCRMFHQDGYRVAPFKSQSMALNSYTPSTAGISLPSTMIVTIFFSSRSPKII